MTTIFLPSSSEIDINLSLLFLAKKAHFSVISHKSLKVETFFAVTMRGRKHETGLTRDYSDHPLVLGPGFQPNDFDLQVS